MARLASSEALKSGWEKNKTNHTYRFQADRPSWIVKEVALISRDGVLKDGKCRSPPCAADSAREMVSPYQRRSPPRLRFCPSVSAQRASGTPEREGARGGGAEKVNSPRRPIKAVSEGVSAAA